MTKLNAASVPARQSGQIASVQVLRALAALTVVFGHAQHDALITATRAGVAFARNHMLPWGAGVDLFFVISGFIMVHASTRLFGQQDGAAEFMRRRLIRIVPLYWLLATAYLLLAYSIGNAGEKTPLTLLGLLTSYLFWPFDLFTDGHPRPFYTLGWTLNYEMFFYVVFAMFIGMARHRAVIAVSLILTCGVIAGQIVTPALTPLRFWSQPIVLEFVLGMGIALAYAQGHRLPRPLGMLAIALGLAILLADPMGAAHKPDDWITPNDAIRLAYWGVPAALILGAFVLMPRTEALRPRNAFSSFWVKLGDASYALYLVHPFVVVSFRKAWVMSGMIERFGVWPLVALTTTVSVLVAMLIYDLLEKPLSARLQGAPAARPVLATAQGR